MKLNDLIPLAIDTLRDPRDVAARLIAMDVGLPTLWTALGLAAVLNAVLFSVNLMMFPTSFPLPALFFNPIVYSIVMAGGMVITMHLLTWIGAKMGGQGRLADVTVVLVWLQYLRLAAQLALMILTTLIPVVGMMATLAVAFYSLWLLLNFLDVAHRFTSLGKTALLLVFSVVGITIALPVLLSLVGAPVPEVS